MEIKNVADNLKKLKIALKQFLYIRRLLQSWIMYCITKTYYYFGISFEVLSYGTLYKHSLTVYYDLIRFPCINLMSYSCIAFTKLFLYFISCLVLYCAYCHFNVMFYIHFVRSMEYWINEKFYSHQSVHSVWIYTDYIS
jgi:hypothetical protein